MTADDHLSDSDTDALFAILRHHSVSTVFGALALWFDAQHVAHERRRQPDLAAECAIARDFAESVVTAVSELAANDAIQSAALCEQLRASLERTKATKEAA